MAIEYKHVEGKDKGKVRLYALSTCIWCKKTKNLLSDLDVDYYYVDVDLLEEQGKEEAVNEIKKFNAGGGFPTTIVDDSECIVGFDEAKIKEVLGNE
jgi:glutaredoxin-like protein NrdH